MIPSASSNIGLLAVVLAACHGSSIHGDLGAADASAVLDGATDGAVMDAAGSLDSEGPPVIDASEPQVTYDYYISTTGSDGNAGTLASPWAITTLQTTSANFSKLFGKNIGLLPGTYDVSSLMRNDSVSGALQVPGASAAPGTFLGSADAAGHYSPRTATLNAKSPGGVYGGAVSTGPGSWNGPLLSHSGRYPSVYPVGNVTIDGLIFTGFSYKGVRIGGASSGDGPSGIKNVTIQNCELAGGAHNAGDPTDNTTALWVDGTIGTVIANNYFHDNAGFSANSADHLNAIILWGPSDGTTTQGTIIRYNTVVHAGSVYGKETGIQGSTVELNYIDASTYTTGAYGVEDFTGANTSGLTQTTTINNNIVITSAFGIGRPTLSDSYGYSTPVNIYNNTIMGKNTAYTALWATAEPTGQGALQVYNNLYTGLPDGSGYKTFLTDPKAPSVWDYNLYVATGMSWALRNDSALNTLLANYTTQAGFASAMSSNGGISGADSHSVASDTPGFVGTGTSAQKFKLAATSAAKTVGRSNGKSTGTACDIGAWGGALPPSQIGASFAP